MLVAALVMFLAVPWDSFGANETAAADPSVATATDKPQEQTAEQKAAARAWYKVANTYRAKAHSYHHRMGLPGHLAGTHGKLPYVGKVEYEKARALIWKKRAELWYKNYQAYVAKWKPCWNAGFPKWYCPVLYKAATKHGVQHWYKSADLAFIIRHESSFQPHADNPTSTAYGLFQMLSETSSDPYTQTLNGVRYVKSRYGSPANAVAFWHAHHWY